MRRALGASAHTAANSTAAAPRPATGPAAVRGADALAAVARLVSTLQDRRKRDAATLQRTRAQLNAKLAAAAAGDGAAAEAAERYKHLQEMRSFVRDLAACLAHKVAEVEALEEERSAAWTERAAALRSEHAEVMHRPSFALRCGHIAHSLRGRHSHGWAVLALDSILVRAAPGTWPRFSLDLRFAVGSRTARARRSRRCSSRRRWRCCGGGGRR